MIPTTILVAYDFSGASRRATEWARLLHARLHAAVILLHVDVDPFERSSIAADAAGWETPEQRERRGRWLLDELCRVSEEVFGPDAQTVEAKVLRGRPVDEIPRVALEEDVDLIVLGGSGKSAVDRLLLGSTTQEIIRTSALPVLTVH